MGQLNELQIKAAQPRDKEYLLADGEGLYLRVRPTGKAWVYRYKEAGKEAKLSLGRYPAMSLAVARKKARAEAEKRAGGVDPREARREEEERDRVARLTKRNMSIQPTLTIRPGFPMRVMVSKDLVLRPYQPLFFQRGSSQ